MGKYLDSIGLANLIGKIKTALGLKQDTLVSGTNIKTVNGNSLLGSGDVTISGGSSLPSGGSIKDVLVKNGVHAGDLAWRSPDNVVLDAFTVFSEDWQDEGVPYFMWDSPNSVHIEFRDYLPLSGGALTGAARQEFSGNKNWSHKDTVADLKKSNNGLSSGTRYHEWLSYDKNGLIPGGVTNTIASGGNVTTILRSRNYKSDESAVDNSLTLTVAKNGTRTVSVSEAAPWRDALGLGTAATHADSDYALASHSHSEYFSDQVIRTANTVLAAPNRSAGHASFRKLVAADMTGLGDTAKGAGQSSLTAIKAATSVATATTVNLDTITLAAGTWLVTYSVEFASNATGRRVMTLTTNATSLTSTPLYMMSTAAANGLATNLSRSQVIVTTASTTRYLNVYQNSGSALNCRSCIQAVRIA